MLCCMKKTNKQKTKHTPTPTHKANKKQKQNKTKQNKTKQKKIVFHFTKFTTIAQFSIAAILGTPTVKDTLKNKSIWQNDIVVIGKTKLTWKSCITH